jgi:hypothetical protein
MNVVSMESVKRMVFVSVIRDLLGLIALHHIVQITAIIKDPVEIIHAIVEINGQELIAVKNLAHMIVQVTEFAKREHAFAKMDS